MAIKSEAIWINNRNSRNSISSDGPFSPPAYSSSFNRSNLFGFQRSLSVASDGTAQNSPPSSFTNDPFEAPFAGRQRLRTHSFSGQGDDDPWSSSLSTSAPSAPSWRRSNSVSYAADKNLARIDEHSGRVAFGGFGDTIKKSMDKLFHPASQNGAVGTKHRFMASGEDRRDRKEPAKKDQLVSILCDGALR